MERRLTAILAADVVGYSRLMGLDEAGTLASLKAHRHEMADGKIAEHQGRIFKLTGDGMLVEFPSVVNAVACAADIQRRMRARNIDVPEDRRIEFRIGVHLGDIIVEDNDIYGDGVNIAARIETVAKPGGVAVSASVRDNVGNRLDLTFEDMGEHALKNIDRPVRIFAIDISDHTPSSAKPAAALAASTLPASERPSIAVLPFNNMSGDPEQEYFADGITEDIITDLSKISGLSVIARNSVFTFKGKPVDIQDVTKRFNVSTVLEGSVRKVGQRVRVTAQLINSKDGTHLWADRYDRDLTDIFAIQDEITKTIVDQLKVRLLPEEKKAIAQTPTDNVEAYTYYLRGREFFHRRTKSSLQLARRMFTRATELDPRYARAYAGIADCDSCLLSWHGVEISMESLLSTCAEALALDPNLAEAHASHGFALATNGRVEEGIAEFKRAIALDPNSHEGHYFYARHSFAEGDLEKAVELYTRCTDINPDDYRSPLLVMNALHSLGRHDEEARFGRLGLERAERALRSQPENSDPAQLGAIALAALGQHDRAREWADRALVADPNDLNAQYNVACVYSLLGELDRSIDLLEPLLRKSGGHVKSWFKNDSDFDPIRIHPRYADLLQLID